MNAALAAGQKNLTTLSTKRSQMFAEKAGPSIPYEEPSTVVKAITEMMKMVQGK